MYFYPLSDKMKLTDFSDARSSKQIKIGDEYLIT